MATEAELREALLEWHDRAHRLRAENLRLVEAMRFLLEPEFDYPVARARALEILQQYDGRISDAE